MNISYGCPTATSVQVSVDISSSLQPPQNLQVPSHPGQRLAFIFHGFLSMHCSLINTLQIGGAGWQSQLLQSFQLHGLCLFCCSCFDHNDIVLDHISSWAVWFWPYNLLPTSKLILLLSLVSGILYLTQCLCVLCFFSVSFSRLSPSFHRVRFEHLSGF